MEGASATVRCRGISRGELGTLETDPSEVAIAINETLASGVSACSRPRRSRRAFRHGRRCDRHQPQVRSVRAEF